MAAFGLLLLPHLLSWGTGGAGHTGDRRPSQTFSLGTVWVSCDNETSVTIQVQLLSPADSLASPRESKAPWKLEVPIMATGHHPLWSISTAHPSFLFREKQDIRELGGGIESGPGRKLLISNGIRKQLGAFQ